MSEGPHEVVHFRRSARRRVCDRRQLVFGLLRLVAVVLVIEMFWTLNGRHPVAGLIGLVVIGLTFVVWSIDAMLAGGRWLYIVRRARQSSVTWTREEDAIRLIGRRGRRTVVSNIPAGGFCRWDRVPDERPNFGGAIVFVHGDCEWRMRTDWFDDNRLVRRFLEDLIGAGVVVGPPVVTDRTPDEPVRWFGFASRREAVLVGVLLVPLVIARWLVFLLGIGV